MSTATALPGSSRLIHHGVAKLRTGHRWPHPGPGRRQIERGSVINAQCHGPPGGLAARAWMAPMLKDTCA